MYWSGRALYNRLEWTGTESELQCHCHFPQKIEGSVPEMTFSPKGTDQMPLLNRVWDAWRLWLHILRFCWHGQCQYIQNLPLVKSNILLPPLYIKLGLMTDFVKVNGSDRVPFCCVSEKFQGISAAKVMEGVFIGLQICKFFRDEQFNWILSGLGNREWNYFRLVAMNFLGNNKADNCNELMENLLLSYEKLRCIMSLNVLFLRCHQDIFVGNCLALSDENSEYFQHDISAMERTYQANGVHRCWRTIVWQYQEILLNLCTNNRQRSSAVKSRQVSQYTVCQGYCV